MRAIADVIALFLSAGSGNAIEKGLLYLFIAAVLLLLLRGLSRLKPAAKYAKK